ncbi:MAG TPA: hypothetical protein PKD90_12475 [Phnomibacter sp.]|nr:hypothetical protein [Phnomibacter sp.]
MAVAIIASGFKSIAIFTAEYPFLKFLSLYSRGKLMGKNQINQPKGLIGFCHSLYAISKKQACKVPIPIFCTGVILKVVVCIFHNKSFLKEKREKKKAVQGASGHRQPKGSGIKASYAGATGQVNIQTKPALWHLCRTLLAGGKRPAAHLCGTFLLFF